MTGGVTGRGVVSEEPEDDVSPLGGGFMTSAKARCVGSTTGAGLGAQDRSPHVGVASLPTTWGAPLVAEGPALLRNLK